MASLDPLVVKASAGWPSGRRSSPRTPPWKPLRDLVAHGYRLVGLDADSPENLFDADLDAPVGLVLGGETNGISPEVIDLLSLGVRIPMAADVESLNVAAAAAVVCF